MIVLVNELYRNPNLTLSHTLQHFKGELYPKPNLSMFLGMSCALSQDYQHFLETCYKYPVANFLRN